jgi:hypothetical protein
MAEKMTDAAFEKLVAAFKKHKDVSPPEEGNKFGSGGLKVKGKIFAMMASQDRFVVKLPKERVAELSKEGKGEAFAIGARVMKEWLVVHSSPKTWAGLAEEAYRFVKSVKS